MSETLCWKCANAVPNRDGTRGCSWSRKLIPVDGWTAIKTRKKSKDKYVMCSYEVLDCPEFVSDVKENA